MKLAVNAWTFPKEWSYKKMFECANEAGFDAFEVVLDENGEINLDSTVDDMRKIKLAAESVGIEISSVASGLGWKYSLIDSDTEICEKIN